MRRITNVRLARVVLEKLHDFLEDKDQRIIGKDKKDGLELLLINGVVQDNRKGRFSIRRNRTYGRGYDFMEKIGSESAKDVYEKALASTQTNSGKAYHDVFISTGVIDERYGYIITNIGGDAVKSIGYL